MGFAERLEAELPATFGISGVVHVAAWDLAERRCVTRGQPEAVVEAASTIKVLIMLAVLREVHAGTLRWEQRVPVPRERAEGFGVLREMSSVDELSIGDLMTLMIVVSDNAATNVLIDLLGYDAINACGRDCGAAATQVQRHLADAEAHRRGEDNLTTALDQARILDVLATGELLPPDLTAQALGVLTRQQVRDRLPALLPEHEYCANKTGEQVGLRHDVGLIGRRDRPEAVVAVLVDGLTDELSFGYRGGPACGRIAEIGAAVHRCLT